MFRRIVRRTSRHRVIRYVCLTVCSILLLDLLSALRNFRTFNYNLAANTVSNVGDLPKETQHQRIFIAAQFWNNAEVLRDFWQDAVLRLIDTLGVENVYLSIIATKGSDETHEILQDMEAKHLRPRNIQSTIRIDSKTHQDEISQTSTDQKGEDRSGWIYTGDSDPPGRKELRRIPFLAQLRHKSLEPLMRMKKEQGITFDKVLFINDVIFNTSDVLSLLATNAGSYDAACSIDYRLDKRFYDTFVLRDSHFNFAATRYFPIFGSYNSRHAMLAGLPVPVTSCWNGIVAMDALPFYGNQTSPSLAFRGIPDSLASLHVEASECCLIHADLIEKNQVRKGLFLNPAVRVGYTRYGFKTTAYQDLHTGSDGLGWVTLSEYIWGIWNNRWSRWTNPKWLKMNQIEKRVQSWQDAGVKLEEDRYEAGAYCLIDEMQILTSSGKGWKHVGGRHFF